jgi:excisionase family DNA binding protein
MRAAVFRLPAAAIASGRLLAGEPRQDANIRFEYCDFRLFRIGWAPWSIDRSALMTRTASVDITLPEESEVRAAVQGQRELAAYLATNFETQRIQILDDRNVAHQIELPTSALRLLVDILAELAAGNAVRVVPVHAELTTQEAADLLNVSRPHFIKLLETQALPYHRTGKHRRIRFDDLMKFKAERDEASERAMNELAKQAQELKLGYE